MNAARAGRPFLLDGSRSRLPHCSGYLRRIKPPFLLFEVWQIAIAIFGVALTSAFFQDDVDGRAPVVVQDLVHDCSGRWSHRDAFSTQSPRTDAEPQDQEPDDDGDVALHGNRSYDTHTRHKPRGVPATTRAPFSRISATARAESPGRTSTPAMASSRSVTVNPAASASSTECLTQ